MITVREVLDRNDDSSFIDETRDFLVSKIDLSIDIICQLKDCDEQFIKEQGRNMAVYTKNCRMALYPRYFSVYKVSYVLK